MRHAGCAVVGVAVSLSALGVHRAGWPWLALAVATSLLLPWRLLRSGRPRTATSLAAGWLVPFLVALVGRPEGDYVLATDPAGYTLVGTALVVGFLGAAGLAARPAGPRT